MWTRTGFADEIADDLGEQIELLTKLGVKHVEFRSAWGTNVLLLSDEQLDTAKQMFDEAGITLSSVGSPIGKIEIIHDFEEHIEAMHRAVHVAGHFGCSNIRMFSFFIPEGDNPDDHRDEVMRRLRVLTDIAAENDLTLLHENEKDIYGDIPRRCKDIVDTIDSPNLRLVFDPANYVQCGVHPMTDAWPLVGDDVVYIHVKDAIMGTPEVVPAGDGDGQWRELITALKDKGYEGFFSIEPHLGDYTEFGAMSGPELWTKAHNALVGLFDEAEMSYT